MTPLATSRRGPIKHEEGSTPRYGLVTTYVPIGTWGHNFRTSELYIRMHPWLAWRPMLDGSLVPWIA
jgi:hypothetical protein